MIVIGGDDGISKCGLSKACPRAMEARVPKRAKLRRVRRIGLQACGEGGYKLVRGLSQLVYACGCRGARAGGVLVLVCLPLLALPSTGEARPQGCYPRGARTLMANHQGRVYSYRSTAFGCLYSVGRRVRLGEYTSLQSAYDIVRERKFALVGRYIGFESYVEGKENADYLVHVVDLRSGRTVHKAPSGNPTSAEQETQQTYVGLGHVTRLLLRASGSVAWIASDTLYNTYHEVRAIDHSGSRLLDRGSEVEPRYLRLTPGMVLWSRGGIRQHASFR